jgi:hypothetical protein
MKPTFDPRPQELNDPYNLQGPRSGYQNDVADSDWKSAPDEHAERKPRFDSMEAKSRKPGYAKPPGKIPNNPAEIGRGARQSPARRGHLIDSDD